MISPRPQAAAAVPLLQRAQLQVQANRYAYLQKVNAAKMVQKIVTR